MAAPPLPPLLLPRVMYVQMLPCCVWFTCYFSYYYNLFRVWFGVLSLLMSQYELVYEFAVHLVKFRVAEVCCFLVERIQGGRERWSHGSFALSRVAAAGESYTRCKFRETNLLPS